MAQTESDGLKSRKFLGMVGGTSAPFLVASTAAFMGNMTWAEWTSLCQWLIPLALAIYSGANVVETIKRK